MAALLVVATLEEAFKDLLPSQPFLYHTKLIFICVTTPTYTQHVMVVHSLNLVVCISPF